MWYIILCFLVLNSIRVFCWRCSHPQLHQHFGAQDFPSVVGFSGCHSSITCKIRVKFVQKQFNTKKKIIAKGFTSLDELWYSDRCLRHVCYTDGFVQTNWTSETTCSGFKLYDRGDSCHRVFQVKGVLRFDDGLRKIIVTQAYSWNFNIGHWATRKLSHRTLILGLVCAAG